MVATITNLVTVYFGLHAGELPTKEHIRPIILSDNCPYLFSGGIGVNIKGLREVGICSTTSFAM